ncbi:MAG: hypothetical protein WCD00_14795 [Desulfuromonadaceae bacterium]
MAKVSLLSSCVALFLLLSGCGGGTGSAVPLPVNKGVVLSATLKQGIPQTSHPIASIQVEFVLPKRATPILNADGSLQIGETGLKCLNPNGSVPAGSYDPATGTVRFILLPNDVTIGLGTGDIARLTYENSSGAELSPQEIQQTLSYKVVGLGSPDDIDISAQFDTSVSGPSVRIVTYLKP